MSFVYRPSIKSYVWDLDMLAEINDNIPKNTVIFKALMALAQAVGLPTIDTPEYGKIPEE